VLVLADARLSATDEGESNGVGDVLLKLLNMIGSLRKSMKNQTVCAAIHRRLAGDELDFLLSSRK
jgi:hypothetical protein